MTFDDFLALSRVSGLTVSADGRRLVAAIAQYDEEAGRFVSSLWEVDPDGESAAVRLTHSPEGESQPAFAPDGSLLFVSGRSNDTPALWRLPVSGEAAELLTRPAGVSAYRVASSSGSVVVATSMLPGATDARSDEKLRKARKDAGTSAILHTSSPVRAFDDEIGPEETRLQLVIPGEEPKDLVPAPGRALADPEFAVSPDGRTVVTKWAISYPGWPQIQLVAVDTETGERRVLADAADAGFYEPTISPDGRYAACVGWQNPDPQTPPEVWLALIDLRTGETRKFTTDDQPSEPVFAADGGSIFFVSDDHGQRPVFRVDLQTGEVTKLTAAGSFSTVRPAPDGQAVFALRNDLDAPPRPVRIDLRTGEIIDLMPRATMHGKVELVEATTPDGTTIEGWLVLPESTEPAPLVLWIHGGPMASWNGWHWRWNPWLLAANGYAVLLANPGLSTGYGRAMIERAWDGWGAVVQDDLMALADAAAARRDIDADRVAAMGGSFGGYMINWIAGRTDRFRCLVSMSGTWDLDSFQATTDLPGYFLNEWGSPDEHADRYAERTPRRFLKGIRTPMLVIHGGKDQRVPVSQALHLWTDLQRAGVESAYLSFPDESHHIVKPANARVWYETVLAWLDHHVLQQPWAKPGLL